MRQRVELFRNGAWSAFGGMSALILVAPHPGYSATISAYAEYGGYTGSVPGSGDKESDTEYQIFAKPEGTVETAPASSANQDGQLGAATIGSLGSLAIASWKETIENETTGDTNNVLQFETGDFGMTVNSIWWNDGSAFFDVELMQSITYDVLVNDTVIWTSALEITSKSLISDIGSNSPEDYFDVAIYGIAPDGAYAPFGYPDTLTVFSETDFFQAVAGYSGTGSEYEVDLGDLESGSSLTVEYRLTVFANSICDPILGLVCESVLFPHGAGAGFTDGLFVSGDPSGYARVVSTPVDPGPAPVPLPAAGFALASAIGCLAFSRIKTCKTGNPLSHGS